jgi:hypothetical protein
LCIHWLISSMSNWLVITSTERMLPHRSTIWCRPGRRRSTKPRTTPDLTQDEKLALVAHLRHALEHDPFPSAPRLDPLKAILAKLEPPAPQPEPFPPLRPGMGPSPRARKTQAMRSSWIFDGTVIAAVLLGCAPPVQYLGAQAYLHLPAPLEGKTVAEGDLCDAQAITQAVRHKYPDSDPAMAEQEVQHLLCILLVVVPPRLPPPRHSQFMVRPQVSRGRFLPPRHLQTKSPLRDAVGNTCYPSASTRRSPYRLL